VAEIDPVDQPLAVDDFVQDQVVARPAVEAGDREDLLQVQRVVVQVAGGQQPPRRR
jgi:hypothetical protein